MVWTTDLQMMSEKQSANTCLSICYNIRSETKKNKRGLTMKPLKLLLLLCLITCVDGWAQAIYYVTKEGAGNLSGENWQNALDETGFSDKFSSSVISVRTRQSCCGTQTRLRQNVQILPGMFC